MPVKKPELTQQQRDEIKQMFDIFDMDSSGSIDFEELNTAMRAMGFEATEADIHNMMESMDDDGEGAEGAGEVEFDEFMLLMEKKLLDFDPKEDIQRAFGWFDEAGTGQITLEDMQRIAKQVGDDISEDELKAIIAGVTKGRETLDDDDFMRIMVNQKKL